MFKIADLTLALAAIAFMPAAANAACYRYDLQPVTLSCADDRGDSADFGTPCKGRSDTIVRVEIACPPPPKPASTRKPSSGGSSYGDNCACDHKSDGGWH